VPLLPRYKLELAFLGMCCYTQRVGADKLFQVGITAEQAARPC
jgi:hypothetical protein